MKKALDFAIQLQVLPLPSASASPISCLKQPEERSLMCKAPYLHYIKAKKEEEACIKNNTQATDCPTSLCFMRKFNISQIIFVDYHTMFTWALLVTSFALVANESVFLVCST